MMALLEADIRPKDLDSAFATICANDDVDFPPGEADCPDPKPARKALDEFWTELQKHLPPKSIRTQPVEIQTSGTTVSGTVSCLATPSRPPFCRRVPAGHVGLRIKDRPEVVGGFSRQRRSVLRDLIEGLHRELP